jgi:hypothetical protein
LLEDVRARSERETGGEAEFQCLLRDRELLSSQLLEAQRRLKELENKPEEKKKERREVMLPPPVETQSLLVAPLTPADLALQKKFGLPESERQIAVHGGTFLQQHGFVYLSDEHICFGGSAVKSFFEKKDLIIALKNVAAIDKTGSKSHVKIVLKVRVCMLLLLMCWNSNFVEKGRNLPRFFRNSAQEIVRRASSNRWSQTWSCCN